MKCLILSRGINPFLIDRTKSIFSSKQPRVRTNSNRLSRFRGLPLRLALSALLATLTLAASMFERGRSTAAFAESIGTFASSDCLTVKTVWGLNETACAVATGTTGERRIVWGAPDCSIANVSTPFSGNGSDTYTFLPSGPFAQYGTWTVKTVDASGGGFALASFLVRDASVDNVDLVV